MKIVKMQKCESSQNVQMPKPSKRGNVKTVITQQCKNGKISKRSKGKNVKTVKMQKQSKI